MEVAVSQLSWNSAILFCNARSKVEGLDTIYRYTSLSGIASSSPTMITPGDSINPPVFNFATHQPIILENSNANLPGNG